MDFEKTVGKKYKFYGVHDTTFKIGPHLFEAEEDESDGYRSYLRCVNVVQDERLVFLRRSFATVEVVDITDTDCLFEGYALVDVDTNHCWLQFGTDNSDDYYPMFIFTYKLPEQKWLEDKHAKVRQQTRWFDPEISKLHRQVHDYIVEQEYDEAEKTIKKLKKLIDKQKKRH